MDDTPTERSGTSGFLPLVLILLLAPAFPQASATTLLLGSGPQTNHLIILFSPGQSLHYEFRHTGSVQTGADLLAAVIQATGGTLVTTLPRDDGGTFITLQEARTGWNGSGLFAHFQDYGWGVLVNGFASGGLAAASDGNWDSYFSYQTSGAEANFTAAQVGATERTLSPGDMDAYVFTGSSPAPGLAAWQAAHQITNLAADPDGDGMNNRLEYALRRNPRRADRLEAWQSGWMRSNGVDFLTLTYRRPHDEFAEPPPGTDATYDGFRYTVETSSNLVTWVAGSNEVAQTQVPDATGPMVTVTARIPAGPQRRFLRLRIEAP